LPGARRASPLAEDEDCVAILRESFLIEHVNEGIAGVVLDDLAELAEETVEHFDLESVDDAVRLFLGKLASTRSVRIEQKASGV
jgi:hypothetical protein